MSTLYEDLGVDKGVPPSVIKAAYRKLASQHHPDREGGDAEKFKVIQKAYDVLGDEDKRKRYDETGEIDEEDSIRKQALHNLAGLLLHIVDTIDVVNQSVKELMLKAIRMNAEEINKSIEEAKKKITLRERVIKRFKRKSGEDDYMGGILEGSIRAERQAILNAQMTLQICDDMTAIIENYDYSVGGKPGISDVQRKIYLGTNAANWR